MRTAQGLRIIALTPVLALGVVSAADAALVEVRTEANGHQYLSYTADAGETNQVTVGPYVFGSPNYDDGWHVVSELGAPLRLGDGCVVDAPVRCSLPRFGGVRVDGGDKDDRLSSAAHWTDSEVWGGAGDDEIFADGWYRSEAWGGAGEDAITLSAEDASYGHGGAGDDRIWTASTTYAYLFGDAGDDVLNLGVTGSADGGAGDDTITFRGRRGTGLVAGGTGSDTITAPGARVDAGSGADQVDVSGGTGPGSGAGDPVSCGSGKDVVRADAGDVIAADCETVEVIPPVG